MKRISPYRSDGEGLTLQMTPLIDTIFLLLIFFVCTSTFRPQEELLPTPITAMMGSTPSVEVVELPPDFDWLGDLEIVIRFHFEKKPYWDIHDTRYDTSEAIAGVLKAMAGQSAEIPVILDIDENVPMEYIISVYDEARRAGFKRVQFAVSGEW